MDRQLGVGTVCPDFNRKWLKLQQLCKRSRFIIKKWNPLSVYKCIFLLKYIYIYISIASPFKRWTSFNALLRNCTHYVIFLQNVFKFCLLICVCGAGWGHAYGCQGTRCGILASTVGAPGIKRRPLGWMGRALIPWAILLALWFCNGSAAYFPFLKRRQWSTGKGGCTWLLHSFYAEMETGGQRSGQRWAWG